VKVRRIILSTYDERRVILYPEGGVEVETFVSGIGWTLDVEGDTPDAEVAGLIRDALAVVTKAAKPDAGDQAARLAALRDEMRTVLAIENRNRPLNDRERATFAAFLDSLLNDQAGA
jgi:hypothetical protein